MVEINHVSFRYEPISGDLFLDSFRLEFYTERLVDVKDTLQYCCAAEGVVRDVQGEIRFSAGRDAPVLREIEYRDLRDREELGPAFSSTSVALWQTD